jgi:predicted nucleic acid-binding protein
VSVAKLVVHTDVILDHLCGESHPSAMRLAAGKFFCYATVFQAIELFSYARTEGDRKAVEDVMAAIKLLGLNPRNARRYGDLLRSAPRSDTFAMLTAGLCLESRLPLLTGRKKDFVRMRGVMIVSPAMIRQPGSGTEILDRVRRGSTQ